MTSWLAVIAGSRRPGLVASVTSSHPLRIPVRSLAPGRVAQETRNPSVARSAGGEHFTLGKYPRGGFS